MFCATWLNIVFVWTGHTRHGIFCASDYWQVPLMVCSQHMTWTGTDLQVTQLATKWPSCTTHSLVVRISVTTWFAVTKWNYDGWYSVSLCAADIRSGIHVLGRTGVSSAQFSSCVCCLYLRHHQACLKHWRRTWSHWKVDAKHHGMSWAISSEMWQINFNTEAILLSTSTVSK